MKLITLHSNFYSEAGSPGELLKNCIGLTPSIDMTHSLVEMMLTYNFFLRLGTRFFDKR